MLKAPLMPMVCMLLASSIVSANAAFSDVLDSSEYFPAINYVQEKGFVQGYADKTFRPQIQINRAEFTKIIVEAKFPAADTDTCIEEKRSTKQFADVSSQDWFAGYVCFAEAEKIINGYPDGTFKPAANINFAEAAKIIANTFQLSDPAPENNQAWYRGYIRALEYAYAIPTSITDLDQKVSRGEVAEMLYRVKEEIRDKTSSSYVSLTEKNTYWNTYRKWFIPAEVFYYELAQGRKDSEITTSNDCVAMASGATHGGDLLATLIADNGSRQMVALSKYTPDFLKALENRIVSYTRSKFTSDFYAYRVCDLGNNIHLIGGYLWPQNTSTRSADDTVDMTSETASKSVLVDYAGTLVDYKDIWAMDYTATGDSTGPCEATSPNKSSVVLKCFRGFSESETDEMKSKYTTYTLGNNGTIVAFTIEE